MADPATLIRIIEAAHGGARREDIGSFQSLTPRFEDLLGSLRESYQSSVAAPARAVIEKLRRGADPSPDDLALIESFVVGDAEAYTRMENDFQNWLAELTRLVRSLSAKSGRLEGPTSLDAMGEVQDAQRVLGDICNYLEQAERVARYKRTTSKPLDSEGKAMLAEILERQLASADE
ncbi:MAG TPA: hypothetical protein VKQ32_21055 [Polyangia bacterium]|nr:hypothetical protein [Polyangia bacterium]